MINFCVFFLNIFESEVVDKEVCDKRNIANFIIVIAIRGTFCSFFFAYFKLNIPSSQSHLALTMRFKKNV